MSSNNLREYFKIVIKSRTRYRWTLIEKASFLIYNKKTVCLSGRSKLPLRTDGRLETGETRWLI